VTSAAPDEGMRAWRAFLRGHAAITRVLETELVADHDLPLGLYDVLVQLSEAPGQALRMRELAEAVLLSRSGLTRLVDRMVRDGLVERRSCPSDARGTMAALTDAGLQRIRDAAPDHLRGMREHFAGCYDKAELATLASLLERLSDPEALPDPGGCAQVA